jgi:hypothetical protein
VSIAIVVANKYREHRKVANWREHSEQRKQKKRCIGGAMKKLLGWFIWVSVTLLTQVMCKAPFYPVRRVAQKILMWWVAAPIKLPYETNNYLSRKAAGR